MANHFKYIEGLFKVCWNVELANAHRADKMRVVQESARSGEGPDELRKNGHRAPRGGSVQQPGHFVFQTYCRPDGWAHWRKGYMICPGR